MSEYPQMITQLRRQKDEFFETHPDSPLGDMYKKNFKGLKYYPLNEKLRFRNVRLEEFPDPKKEYLMERTGGDIVRYYIHGKVSFDISSKKCELIVYTNPDVGRNYYFIPFWDETALTNETYGAGRYLELERDFNGDFTLDFNLSYNPYCVYSPLFSCPLTPIENRLKVRIEAGEKNFK